MNYDKINEHEEWREQLPPLLTPAEVMDILGIGKNSIYQLLNSGRLRAFRIGRSWRISGDALEDFMESPHAHKDT